jgi:hypothetical protein
MDKLDNEIIERYMDGELSKSQAEHVASVLGTSQESQSHLDRSRKLGNLIRMGNAALTRDISFEGLSERVMKEIGNATSPLPFTTRIGIWLQEFFEHRRAVWIPAAAMSAAVVLALLILPLFPTTQSAQRVSTESGFTLHSTEANIIGSRIASVDFGTAAGKTFNLQRASGGTVGVVWIRENP